MAHSQTIHMVILIRCTYERIMFVYFCLTSKIPEGNHQQLTTPQQIPTKDPMKNLMKFPAGLAKGPREEVTGRRLRGVTWDLGLTCNHRRGRLIDLPVVAQQGHFHGKP